MIATETATSPFDPHVRRAVPEWRRTLLLLVPILTAGVTVWCIWVFPETLSPQGRIALIITALALIGWVATPLPESLVALASAVALVLTGVIAETQLYAILGSDLVWLLLAAFIIAAVLKECGLAERMILPLLSRQMHFVTFAFTLATAIALTAFLLPSTSGRAALLLPVFLALIPHLPDERLRRPLALLFPTVILLSAGGSLIGAGAHLVAVEAIVATGGDRLSYLDWLMLGAPLAFLASAAGVLLILVLFVPRALWRERIGWARMREPLTPRQWRVLCVVSILVGLWLTEPLHGFGMALVAVVGAMALLTKPFTRSKTKEVFRAVDVELILYMAATTLIAYSMTQSGADRWLAGQALAWLPASLTASKTAMVIVVAIVAMVAHIVIASRSARAAVLVPAVALPVAGLGHEATVMILVVVMGSGFCQSLMAGAKPVAIFGMREEGGFTQADLARLALPLGMAKLTLLVGIALFVWPHQIAGAGTERMVLAQDDKPAMAVIHLPPLTLLPPITTSNIVETIAATKTKAQEPAANVKPEIRREASSPRTKRDTSNRNNIEKSIDRAIRDIGADIRNIFR
ncbi:anion permease [Peteryoungia desertarenae]|uniref:Anion permease n=2 Tax=Peteryoungia desertarenae TaxID=1813451 RepID=A0ABX6QSV9_9HYPH|nr:anion permease [Peteryoungia desertarenae]